jgi:hypothetical protein
MKREAYRHPKMYDLASRLGVSRATAIGTIQLLLDYTADVAPQGNIGKWPDGAISRGCEWPGDPTEFVEALVASGWIDRCNKYRLVVHDLKDHADNWWKLKLGKLRIGFLTAEPSAEPSAERSVEPSLEASPPRDPFSSLLVSTLPSSSQAVTTIEPIKGEDCGFSELWAVYPRKEDELNSRRAWVARFPTREFLDMNLAAIKSQLAAGKEPSYFPSLSKWLSGERWRDQVTEKSSEGNKTPLERLQQARKDLHAKNGSGK